MIVNLKNIAAQSYIWQLPKRLLQFILAQFESGVTNELAFMGGKNMFPNTPDGFIFTDELVSILPCITCTRNNNAIVEAVELIVALIDKIVNGKP